MAICTGLKAVNAAINKRAPDVPHPFTILSQVPADSQQFSIIDFSIPVHKDSEYWFAFMFDGKPYNYTLCQGYCESPTIYNQMLKDTHTYSWLRPFATCR